MSAATLAVVLVGFLAAPVIAVGTMPNEADLFESAEPAADSVVVSAPSHLRLEFTETLVPGTGEIRLFTSGVESSAVGETTTAGRVLEANLDSVAEGRHLVAWAVEGETSGDVSGGYFFTIDSDGVGAIEVGRRIDDPRSAGGLPIVASIVAIAAGFLLVGMLIATAIESGAMNAKVTTVAAAAIAGSAAVVFAISGGRGWIAAIAATLVVPLLLVLRRDDPGAPERFGWRLGVAGVCLVLFVGISVGAGQLLAVGPWVVALAFVVATGAAVAWFLDQRVVAVFGVVGVATVLFVGVLLTRPTGHSATLEGETLALEVDIQPARRGVNEVHLYAFGSTGGLAPLAASEAWITHLPTSVGPIRVPLLRAGPNHFLTYTADLPLAGEWQVDFVAAGEGGEAAHLDTIVNVR